MKKILTFLLSFSCLLAINAINVDAATGRIDCDDRTITVGEQIDIRVSYQFAKKSTAKFSVNSDDTSVAKFNLTVFDSGSDYSGVMSGSKVAKLTATGPGSVVLVASDVDVVENDSEESVSLRGGCTIKVVAKNSDNNNNSNNNNSNTNTNTNNTNNNAPTSPSKPTTGQVSPLKKSPNNLLSSLNVDQGKLVPDFNSKENNYTVELNNSVKSINVSGILADSKASSKNLKQTVNWTGKEQTISIEVIAENGSKNSYTIKFIPSKEVLLERVFKSEKYQLNLNDISLGSLTKVSKTVNNNKYDIYSKNNLLYAIASNNNQHFLAKLDDKLEIVELSKLLSVNKELYSININNDNITTTDSGLVNGNFKISNEEFSGFKFEDPALSKYVLIQGSKLGESTLERYIFDTTNNQLFSIGNSLLISDNNYKDLVNKFQTQLNETNKAKQVQQNDKRIYILSIVVLSFIGAMLGLVALKYKRLYNKIGS